MNRLFKVMFGMALTMCSLSVQANVSEQLLRICGASKLSVKQHVTIGRSQRVELLQGGMLSIDTVGIAPTDALLKTELSRLGLDQNCAEYFVSQGKTNEMNGRVYFDFDSDQLTPISKEILNNVLDKVRQSPNTITFEGHTDSIGEHAYNFALGIKRAESVKQFFVSEGVEAKDLQTVSYGETQPIAPNNTEEGRKLNRRVELKAMNNSGSSW